MKRLFETQVQLLKYNILKHVAVHAWQDKMMEAYTDVPDTIVGDGLHLRCCKFKERYIVQERIKLASGKMKDRDPIINVIATACDECPVEGHVITDHCRGCLAHHCQDACPKKAIVIDHRGKASINKDLCVECGRCLDVCPYSAIANRRRPCQKACKVGAVKINEVTYAASIDHDKCITCGACVYQCPFGALVDRSYLLEAIDLLKDKDRRVYAVLAPAVAAQMTHHTIPQLISALKQLGFYEVVEAALGADIVAGDESKELLEKGFLTSSCCPSFVNYIHKYQPQMLEHVSHNPSPMIVVGRLIKKNDPGAAVVFIGPCTAKKMEAQTVDEGDAVDVVITFSELQSLLDSREIDWESLQTEELDNASYYGRIFARSGGLSEAVTQALKETGEDPDLFKPVVANGIEECRRQLLLASNGRLQGNFIEGMVCMDGCVGGAGSVIHRTKAIADVDGYAGLAQDKKLHDSEKVFLEIRR